MRYHDAQCRSVRNKSHFPNGKFQESIREGWFYGTTFLRINFTTDLSDPHIYIQIACTYPDGTTSAWSPSTQLHWRNVIANVRKLRWANHMPTMSAMLEQIWSENTCSLIFWRGTCFPNVKYKISHNTGFERKCTINIIYLWK